MNLTFMYPRWTIDASAWWQYLFPAGFVALVIALVAGRRRFGRAPAAAVLAFAVLVFPALGFFNVYPHRFSFVADHFQYLASIPLIALAVAGIFLMLSKLQLERTVMPIVVGCVLLGILGTMTWHQTSMYLDEETLYRETIVRNPDAWLAYNNLGYMLLDRGETLRARQMFEKCLDIEEAEIDRHVQLSNIGLCYASDGNWKASADYYKRSIARRDDVGFAHANLAMAQLRLDEIDDAIASAARAIELEPTNVGYRIAASDIFATQKRYSEAAEQLRAAVEISPQDPTLHMRLSRVLGLDNQLDDAIEECRIAVFLEPNVFEWYIVMANFLAKQERYYDAWQAAEQSFKLASAQGQTEFAEQVRELMAEYTKKANAQNEPETPAAPSEESP